jgi:glycerol-3-phosphate dehydrogenase
VTRFDLLIIGGGINGCGIARDAAGRGLTVYLSEMDDLASGTSSRSTGLIHGGLRYLEHYDFRLVRESLREREVLLRIAPHIVQPLRIVLPYRRGLRPAWLLQLGLFIYDHMGARQQLPPTRRLDLLSDPAGTALKRGLFRTGFAFSDCRGDDARLVVLNARDAADRGAVIRTRTKVVLATRRDRHWDITVEDQATGRRDVIAARALVNAAGPWAEQTLSSCRGVEPARHRRVRLVKGSHIVVPQAFDHGGAYMLQNPDGRILFALPYAGNHTLIGTTERDFAGNPAQAAATPEEIQYLCEGASRYFARSISPADVVWCYAGVRPLYDDQRREATAATRNYALELDAPPAGAPLLSIFGGKITTYRRLAEAALVRLAPCLPSSTMQRAGWTALTALPGGTCEPHALARKLATKHPFLGPRHASRLAATYGERAKLILAGARTSADLGLAFGATLTEAEVRYLMRQEFARTAADVLWRRTKLGLAFSEAEAAALDRFMAVAAAPPAAP